VIRPAYIQQWKDYYETLGVEPDATPGEIRRAYRRLSHQYHPDVNKRPGAEAKFKEIAEAHEYLGDPDLRRDYDHYAGRDSWARAFDPGNQDTGQSGDEFALDDQYAGFRSVLDFSNVEKAARVYEIVRQTLERLKVDGGLAVLRVVEDVSKVVAPSSVGGFRVFPAWALNQIAGSSDGRIAALEGHRILNVNDVRSGVKSAADEFQQAIATEIEINDQAIGILKVAAYEPLLHPTLEPRAPGTVPMPLFFSHMDQARLRFAGLPAVDPGSLIGDPRRKGLESLNDARHRATDYVRPVASELDRRANRPRTPEWYASVEATLSGWQPPTTSPTAIPAALKEVLASAIGIAEHENKQLRGLLVRTHALPTRSETRSISRVSGNVVAPGRKANAPDRGTHLLNK
jgi:curved DNA-binding protein CbpA